MRVEGRIRLIPILLVLAASFGVAQETEETLSVEELYLRSEISIETLALQMRSPERNTQLLAIDTLESQLERGLISPEDDAILDALDPLVGQGVMETFEDNTWGIESYDPVVRREALRIIGRLGTDAAQGILVRTVRHDPEPIVRAQALFGLARMGSDPTGEVTQTIAKMLLREHVGRYDEGVVYAALVALRSIAGDQENVMDPASKEMLVYLASDGRYPRRIRNLALETLSSL